jgi:hypothetical protein
MSRKRSVFSVETFSLIKNLVAQGLPANEIAERVGCKLGTLRVKCSQHRISLRRSPSPAAALKRSGAARLVIPLAEDVSLDLQRHAEKRGLSKASLAAALLEAIANDNLYNAVIDHDLQPKRRRS